MKITTLTSPTFLATVAQMNIEWRARMRPSLSDYCRGVNRMANDCDLLSNLSQAKTVCASRQEAPTPTDHLNAQTGLINPLGDNGSYQNRGTLDMFEAIENNFQQFPNDLRSRRIANRETQRRLVEMATQKVETSDFPAPLF